MANAGDSSAVTTPPDPTASPGGRGGDWFAPVLGPMLRQRRLAVPLAAVGALQVAAGVFHFHTFPCPMLAGLGIPCPGCGASRACGAMVRGDWRGWLDMHAMAPCFVVAALLFAAAAVLPARPRDALVRWLDRIERRTGVVKLLLCLLLVYWLVRVVYAPVAFARQMRG